MAHPKPQRSQVAQGTFQPSPTSTTAPFPEICCRCGTAYPKPQRPQAAQGTFHPSPTSTTAAFPAICCRCGMAHPMPQRPQAAQGTFHPSSTSTTAPFPAICCRCGTAHPMPQRPQATQRTFHPSPTSTTAPFPRFAAVAAWRIRCHNVHRPHRALSTLLPLPQRHRFPRFAAVAAWRIRCHNVHRPHSALSTLLPLPQRHRFPRFAAVAARPFVSNSQLTNGKYCSSHYLQNIDNQPYHNTTRVFRPYLNIRKTLVIFPTVSKSRTYQNTPLLHLPLHPPSPSLNHLPKVGDILSCINGSELRETILQHLHPGHSPTVAVHHRADDIGSRGQVGDEGDTLAYL